MNEGMDLIYGLDMVWSFRVRQTYMSLALQ
jgi:hypothetical protein